MSYTRFRWMVGSLGVGLFALLLALEVASEDEAITPLDLFQEALHLAVTVGASVAVGLLAGRVQTQHAERVNLIRDVKLARAEGESWRRQARVQLEGLGVAIEGQMDRWGLTAAERDVGILMLKGLVHKEIAAVRGTSEATVRQQARAIYEKAGVEGRAGFCAYFLEDMLPSAGVQDTAARGWPTTLD